MSQKDQPFEPKADTASSRVRRSYYSFSKEYPHQAFTLEKTKKKTRSGKRVLRIMLLIACFLAVSCISFFAVDFALRISEKPANEQAPVLTPTVNTDLSNLKALSVSHEVLSGKREARACIRKLNRNDCNAVVIDFKTAEGNLAYTSAELFAIQNNRNLYDSDTVREVLELFQRANIQVIAGVHCFNDHALASFEPSLAVKYLGTDVTWFDADEENGGKAWVNPYATKGRAYLKAVISEIASFGVNGILLKNLSFPVGEAVDTASFPGEEASVKRNKLLKNLIHSIKGSLPETCALLLSVDANDIAGSETRFDGSIFPNECDAVLCNTAIRPQTVTLNKEDGYMDALLYFNELFSETTNEAFVLEIPKNEASANYLRTLSRNGYAAVVIDEK
ncbi:MAG: hypothetical protein IJU56_08705 [Clostridia bacterium]|nr:hypothetical protein [Clostridia bacterium]